jgi:hypothetical protein
MTLYSFKGQTPAPLPFRIFLSDGSSRTVPSTFTEEELRDAGFTGPFVYPEYDSKIQTIGWNGSEFILRDYNESEICAQWELIRKKRNQLLEETDWTQVQDYEFNLDDCQCWTIYRQNLRDIPQAQSNPFDILWPEPPGA